MLFGTLFQIFHWSLDIQSLTCGALLTQDQPLPKTTLTQQNWNINDSWLTFGIILVSFVMYFRDCFLNVLGDGILEGLLYILIQKWSKIMMVSPSLFHTFGTLSRYLFDLVPQRCLWRFLGPFLDPFPLFWVPLLLDLGIENRTFRHRICEAFADYRRPPRRKTYSFQGPPSEGRLERKRAL